MQSDRSYVFAGKPTVCMGFYPLSRCQKAMIASRYHVLIAELRQLMYDGTEARDDILIETAASYCFSRVNDLAFTLFILAL